MLTILVRQLSLVRLGNLNSWYCTTISSWWGHRIPDDEPRGIGYIILTAAGCIIAYYIDVWHNCCIICTSAYGCKVSLIAIVVKQWLEDESSTPVQYNKTPIRPTCVDNSTLNTIITRSYRHFRRSTTNFQNIKYFLILWQKQIKI